MTVTDDVPTPNSVGGYVAGCPSCTWWAETPRGWDFNLALKVLRRMQVEHMTEHVQQADPVTIEPRFDT